MWGQGEPAPLTEWAGQGLEGEERPRLDWGPRGCRPAWDLLHHCRPKRSLRWL